MWGSVVGVMAGFALPGGWWSLLAFSGIVGIAIGWWRIFGARRRLARGQDYGGAFRDAYNIAITSGVADPEQAALRIMESRDVPNPTLGSYGRACTWEIVATAVAASAARVVTLVFFAG